MNISQVFYLARCASKTPEEREEISFIEAQYNKLVPLAQELAKEAHMPGKTDIGSAHLILALRDTYVMAQKVKNIFEGYSTINGRLVHSSTMLAPGRSTDIMVGEVTQGRSEWENVCRTQEQWDEYKKYGYLAETANRQSVLRALEKSYTTEHAEVPEWITAEIWSYWPARKHTVKTESKRPTKKRK